MDALGTREDSLEQAERLFPAIMHWSMSLKARAFRQLLLRQKLLRMLRKSRIDQYFRRWRHAIAIQTAHRRIARFSCILPILRAWHVHINLVSKFRKIETFRALKMWTYISKMKKNLKSSTQLRIISKSFNKMMQLHDIFESIQKTHKHAIMRNGWDRMCLAQRIYSYPQETVSIYLHWKYWSKIAYALETTKAYHTRSVARLVVFNFNVLYLYRRAQKKRVFKRLRVHAEEQKMLREYSMERINILMAIKAYSKWKRTALEVRNAVKLYLRYNLRRWMLALEKSER